MVPNRYENGIWKTSKVVELDHRDHVNVIHKSYARVQRVETTQVYLSSKH